MTPVIENTATLLQSTELCFRNGYKDPYRILDTEKATIAEVAYALLHSPIAKLQLRIIATKELPPGPFDPLTNDPHLEEEFMYVYKRSRKIANENLNEEVRKATRDLFGVADKPIYHKGKLRAFAYFNIL